MIVVFAGAGASRAISAEKYPTTADFFAKHLPDQIRNRDSFKLIEDYVANSKVIAARESGNGSANTSLIANDIEEILFAASELIELLEVFSQPSRIGHFALHHLKVQSFLGGSYGNSMTAPLGNMLAEFESLRKSINVLVHDVYQSLPDEHSLAKTWAPLLRLLHSTMHRIEIFTTNYDAVIEEALEGSSVKMNMGIARRGTYAQLGLENWEKNSLDEASPGLLTKLHGSLNWTLGKGSKIYVGGPDVVEQARQVAIYPGYKGKPSSQPFAAFHEHLRRCLSKADNIIFIGFAFRDQYINELVDQVADRKIRRFYVNPDANYRYASTKGWTTINTGFEESLTELTKYLV